MKIICEREAFHAAYQIAASVAPTRSPKPILQNVKLEATEQGTVLTATDLEVGVRVEAQGVQVERPGVVVLPVAQMNSILRESSDDQLTIELKETTIEVRGQHSRFKLPSNAPEEFPAVPKFDEEKYHTIESRLFKEMIRRTLFATDVESTRYALGGVLLEMDEKSIVAVGTDGRRLAKMEGPALSVGGHSSGESSTIVPTKSMQLIDRALLDNDSEIEIAARGNDILVRSPRAIISSRLVEGRFPKWRDVLPQRTGAQQISLTVGPFFSALRQAAIVASQESRGIEFLFSEGNLVMTGMTADVGESQVEMPISFEGEPIKLCLDHRFVGDFFRVLDADRTITLEIQDAESAALFTTDDGYGYVVMPLSQ